MRRILVLLVLSAACAGDPPPPAPSVAKTVFAPRPELLVAGTGAMTPLAMALAREASAGTGMRVRVEPSIGSGGGIAATRDGAVDLGLVSRPLRADESGGLERVDLARDAVVLAAAPDVPVDDLSTDDLHRLYRGELRGLTVLLRDEAESANAALEANYPGLAEERRRSAASGRARVLDHDDAMAIALATVPRSVGVFSSAALRSPLRALRIDGVLPSAEAVAHGSWRPVRTLGVVFRPERRDRVAPFLALATSERARLTMRSLGYLPLEPAR
ncbi:MAG TPA: substrate-binding domain-containing protein [Myxococcaceae bacterium]|nr:substrate-binding domain-containing protein [Myxococcaceae bacterium]